MTTTPMLAACSQYPYSNEKMVKVPYLHKMPIHVSDQAKTAPTNRKGRTGPRPPRTRAMIATAATEATPPNK